MTQAWWHRASAASAVAPIGVNTSGSARVTKRAPPTLTKSRRVSVGSSKHHLSTLLKRPSLLAARCTASMMRHIGAAAAQVRRGRRIREGVLYLRDRRIRHPLQQLDGRDHHATLTESTLRNLHVNPRLLNRVQRLRRLLRREALLRGPQRRQAFDVLIFLPANVRTGVTHDRTSLPSTSTAQDPHWAIPQPRRGPDRCSSFVST